MWVYVLVLIGFVLMLAVLHGIMELLCSREQLKQSKDANAHLISKNRKLEAENRKLLEDNRMLISKLSHTETRISNRWEMRLEDAMGKIGELERELKVKDALLKALEGKVAV